MNKEEDGNAHKNEGNDADSDEGNNTEPDEDWGRKTILPDSENKIQNNWEKK